jgi:hypothetical protein
MELYDVAGRKMQTIVNGNLSAGIHEAILNRDQLKHESILSGSA